MPRRGACPRSQSRGLTSIPFFPPLLSNHQVLVLAASQPGPPGPLSLPVPGMIIANVDPWEDRFFFADEKRFYELTLRLNTYVPAALMLDLGCGA